MSIYRLATANSFDRTINNINRRQSDLAQLQDQLSSGKRVTKASDDAVAATMVERAQNRLARTKADQTALDVSTTSLTLVEGALGDANDLLNKARELVVQAGDPTLSQSTREDVARQLESLREQLLEVSNRKDTNGLTLFGGLGGSSQPFADLYGAFTGVQFSGQAGQYAATATSLPQSVDGSSVWMRVQAGNGNFSVALDNNNQGLVRTDQGVVVDASQAVGLDTGAGYGGYVFTMGGTREAPTFTVERVITSPPSTEAVPGFFGPQPYQAGKMIEFDGIQLTLSGDPMGVGDPTQAALGTDPVPADVIQLTPVQTPTDLFATMQSAIDALRYTGDNQKAHITQELDRVLTQMDSGADRILDARGRVGEWLNRADTVGEVLADKALFHQKEKSDQQDLDMVQGISDFQNQQLGLQAALQSYGQVQKLSLFQYIA
jgi:flagellar hook-associated protein 3 FlgL